VSSSSVSGSSLLSPESDLKKLEDTGGENDVEIPELEQIENVA
jgi:hypothetical protein